MSLRTAMLCTFPDVSPALPLSSTTVSRFVMQNSIVPAFEVPYVLVRCVLLVLNSLAAAQSLSLELSAVDSLRHRAQ